MRAPSGCLVHRILGICLACFAIETNFEKKTILQSFKMQGGLDEVMLLCVEISLFVSAADMDFLRQNVSSDQAPFEPAKLDFLASCGDEMHARI